VKFVEELKELVKDVNEIGRELPQLVRELPVLPKRELQYREGAYGITELLSKSGRIKELENLLGEEIEKARERVEKERFVLPR